MKQVQITSGRWYEVTGFTHTVCCDCSLVHKEELKLKDGKLLWRVFVDKKKTDLLRKQAGIKVTRSK